MESLAKEMSNRNGGKGISMSALSNIVNGNPTLSKLQEISSITGIPLPVLVSDYPKTGDLVCPHCGKAFSVYMV